jgi:mycothiol synthase
VNVRAPTPADAEAVAALVAAYDAAHGAPPDVSADDLREEWAELDLDRDAWLFELDGRLAGYACVFGRPGTWSTDGYVHPELRGRGVGTEILRRAEARARELGAGELRNATLHGDAAGRALFEAGGYAFRRAFLRMEIELDREPPEPRLPDGLVLEPARPGDEQAVHDVVEEAFADHWGHSAETFEDWSRRRLEGADLSLWRVVRDGDRLAAVSVNQWKRFGAGWVASLGTRRGYRRRGLGEALLLASFREFRRRGEAVVRLGVDSESPTGAVRLYERVGMHVVWRADVYGKEL